MKQWSDLLKLLRGHAVTYAIASGALLVGTGTILLVPRFLGKVVSSFHDLAAGRDAPAARHALYFIVGLLLLDALATVSYAFLVAIASEKIVNQLRARFFHNLLRQPLDERPPKRLGEIASEFSSDLALFMGRIRFLGLFGFRPRR